MPLIADTKLLPAIFLDRDGTLNEDAGYVHACEDWRWLPDVPKALAIFAKAGYLLVVATNQSGIARGFYDIKAMESLHNFVNSDLAQKAHCAIDAFYYCPHHPDFTGECQCRKPQPGMLLNAAKKLCIDLEKSWMIGDHVRDVQAGQKAGCRTLLLTKNNTFPEFRSVQTLMQAAQLILQEDKK